MAQLNEAVERDKAKQMETAARARELEAKVKDIKGHRERLVVQKFFFVLFLTISGSCS